MSRPTPEAEQLKAHGNAMYQRGKYGAAIDAYKSRRRSARKESAGSVGFVRVALCGAANDNFLIPIITGGVMWGARVALLG